MSGLGKLAPQLPAYSVFYWDGFTGLRFVLVGLAGLSGLLEELLHPVGVILLGVSLNAFSMARRCVHHIGNVRRGCQGYWPDIRKQAYPTFFVLLFWVFIFWVCCRYAALNFQITR
jgi:hypothetical protein